MKAEAICADVEDELALGVEDEAVLDVELETPRALSTWARLICPLEPSAEMIEFAALVSQLFDWLCA